MKKKKQSFPHEPGECQICADKGSRPAEAIACAWHSVYTIKELQAEIAVLKDTASASSRLHLALAELYGFVPSTDGQDELNAVREDHARMDRVRDAIEHALAIANYDDEPVSSPPSQESELPKLVTCLACGATNQGGWTICYQCRQPLPAPPSQEPGDSK